MTWARRGLAFCVAIGLVVAYGSLTPAVAGVDKGALLSMLAADQSMVHGWSLQVLQLAYVGPLQKTPMLTDLSAAAAEVTALRQQTLADSSPLALHNDSMQARNLHVRLMALEDRMVGIASRANDGIGAFNVLTNVLSRTGGFSPTSPYHAQTIQIASELHDAKGKLDTGIGLLALATLAGLQGSVSVLTRAGSDVTEGMAELATANQQVGRLPVAPTHEISLPTQLDLFHDFAVLNQLRSAVSGDPNLNMAERMNLLTQINVEIVTLGQLDMCLAASSNGNCTTRALNLEVLDAFMLIRPKAAIMLGAAGDRSAVADLNGVIPTLRAGIVAAHKTSELDPVLLDLQAQLIGITDELAPIDSELMPLTTFPPAQRTHDVQVLNSTIAALTAAGMKLTTAEGDANQILRALI